MPPLRPPSCWRPPSWPAKPERTAELQSPARGPTPTQILGGPKMSKKKSVRDYGRIECATQFGARDGAGVQVRGAKRDGDARRRVFAARGVYNLHVQPAADRDAPRGRAARDGKSGGAWGFAARARTAEGCTTQAVVARAWCTLPPVRRPGWTRGAFVWQVAVPQGPCRLMAEAARAHLVGVGRRQLLRVPKQWPMGPTWGAVWNKGGTKRGGCGGHWCGDAP